MANAILMNGKAGEEISIINSLIEKYLSQSEIITAGSFIDFVNESSFTSGNNKALSSQTSSGYVNGAEYAMRQSNQYNDYPTHYVYYNIRKEYVFKISDTLVLMFWGFQNTSSTYYNNCALFEVTNNAVSLKAQIRLGGYGTGLRVCQLTDTLFVVASGSYNGCTSTSYPCVLQGIVLDPSAKTLTAGTAVNIDPSYYYRYINLTDIFRVSDTSFVVFYGDGNNSNYWYPCCKACTITAAGAITLGTRYIYTSLGTDQARYKYEVIQIADNKFAEITQINYPIIQIVTVNGTTCSRSGYIQLSASAALNSNSYIYQKTFKYGNYIYIPYYNNSTWTIASVNCSGSAPVLGSYQALPVAGSSMPVIQQVKEDGLMCCQTMGNVLYGKYMKLNNTGGYQVSTVVLTVDERVTKVVGFCQTNENDGFIIANSYGSTVGAICVPVTWIGDVLTAGKPQRWNESYNFSQSYSYWKNIDDHYSICVFEPYEFYSNTGYHNSLNCFSIYQDGTSLSRSDIYTIDKTEAHYDTTAQRVLKIIPDPNGPRAVLLYRQTDTSSTSNYNLRIVSIEVRGNKCYISAPTQLVNYSQVSTKTFDHATLIPLEENSYIACFEYSANSLYGKGITLQPKLKLIAAEKTGHIAGVTITQATPTIEGQISVLKN